MKKKGLCVLLSLVLVFQLSGCVIMPGSQRLQEYQLAQLQEATRPQSGEKTDKEEAPSEKTPAEQTTPEQTAPEQQPEQTVPEKQTPSEPLPDAEAVRPLAYSGYFGPTEATDTHYSDMQVRFWTLEEFEPLAQAVGTAAQNDSAEGFHRAVYEAWDALASMETAYTLLDIRNSGDPLNEEISNGLADMQSVYYDAIDLFCNALHEVAISGHAQILDWEFDDSYIDYFISYDTEEAQKTNELSERELELQFRYEELISAESPDYDALCQVYIDLVELRREMAQAAGYDSFAEYTYDSYYCRDYTPEDARAIWEMARKDFMPLLQQYAGSVYDAADDAYYDTSLDCSPEAVLSAVEYGAEHMSPEVLRAARALIDQGLSDIGYSERKLESGYTASLSEYGLPFIFNCAAEAYTDYTTLFHEFGHFLSFYYNGSDPVFGASDYDLSELQSQGMEIMFLPYYEAIFGDRNARALRAETVLDMIFSIVNGAMYDEFQQRIFAEPELTVRKVQQIYSEVYDSYGFQRYSGYQYEWMQIIHNFEYPFYYISYAVSAIPALQLLVLQQDSPAEAMDSYLRVSAMSDEEYYLSEALDEIGMTGVFEDNTGSALVKAIRRSGILNLR